ncbi:DUF1630-domain-containing protein [Pluteus cervinus]|uniref:DUF1630-domain-containing protein n=1 Tax=Pluteus cervinus TaxID=181527 RepID=A0ACD3BAW3_9AGAR|nr:DUF1630-domain-containing protein [Pluteus cervinus]
MQPELEPIEQDIGDQLSLLTLPAANGITTTFSSNKYSTLVPSHVDLSITTKNVTSPSKIKQNRRLSSPSSPNLSSGFKILPPLPTGSRPPEISRSQTLPRYSSFNAHLEAKPNKRCSEIALSLDPSVVDKMRRWVLAIGIVDFDLDEGPVLTAVFPPLQLSPSEAENISFASFPDSLQFEQGSQTHSFRIREHPPPSGPQRAQSKDGFLYGFSHFTQKRDENSKRGYMQRSVVVLTHLEYPAFFTSIASIFGPLYQAHGIPMLEAACHNLATWHDPVPGTTVELGFLGSVLHLEIPKSNNEQQLTETSSFHEKYDPKRHILASSAPLWPPPLLLFEAALSHLWSIWECLLLGEPILVFGSSPAQTSQAIWWFRDLLRPIPLSGDIRPYFTVQDGDHSILVNKLPPKAGTILGVTNPFFEKSCAHWPHVLSLGGRVTSKSSSRPTTGPPPGWKTKTHKRYISKNRDLLRDLEKACQGNDDARMKASCLLRQHFHSRTTELITPLSRYLNTLIPSPSELSKAKSSNKTPRLKAFNSDNFFASLKASGCTLPFRSAKQKVEFYERWLRTPSFGLWLAQQEVIVQDVLTDHVN